MLPEVTMSPKPNKPSPAVNATPEVNPADEMRAELERLRAENAALKLGKPLTVKLSEKGAVSVYGLQRFPVSLYAPTWRKLLAFSATIQAFLDDPANQAAFAAAEERKRQGKQDQADAEAEADAAALKPAQALTTGKDKFGRTITVPASKATVNAANGF